ncbi:hypothetical protein [Streptomyces hygroscopicus]|uniref:hypothetical protein n=1 Tax=Streptomyces hygroscopicus TaxID=1912 RepID=UPI003D7C339E
MVAGDPAEVAAFTEACERDGIRVRQVSDAFAFHTAQMDAIGEELAAAVAGLSPRPARCSRPPRNTAPMPWLWARCAGTRTIRSGC